MRIVKQGFLVQYVTHCVAQRSAQFTALHALIIQNLNEYKPFGVSNAFYITCNALKNIFRLRAFLEQKKL